MKYSIVIPKKNVVLASNVLAGQVVSDYGSGMEQLYMKIKCDGEGNKPYLLMGEVSSNRCVFVNITTGELVVRLFDKQMVLFTGKAEFMEMTHEEVRAITK